MTTGLLKPGDHARCPHCAKDVVLVRAEFFALESAAGYENIVPFRVDREFPTSLTFSRCPGCKRSIVHAMHDGKSFFVWPRVPVRRKLHASTPVELRIDYEEAMLVLYDSPKASAALSRRCLQTLLVKQGAKKSDLVDQLAEIAPSLPSYVSPFVDHIRQLGNVSAHAKQSKATGDIVDVEPGEAEWMLELLEELFDHYYAKPAEAQAKQAALKAKFADAGKLKP